MPCCMYVLGLRNTLIFIPHSIQADNYYLQEYTKTRNTVGNLYHQCNQLDRSPEDGVLDVVSVTVNVRTSRIILV